MGTGQKDGGGENWFQGLIASALMMGISKQELLRDYYMDELGFIIEAWNERHGIGEKAQEEKVDALTFFGEGGEFVG